eukprot:CAMPEP_0119570760 /NCGR_PEP_ID=MMETSP1352-20130426/43774_1 /TAXON_ID=265584 /ORGANISM="Stauroneis constricta, Strain CCMP1120" /LENGTH=303 /DNA_ID=CAMNT_0007620433 /DNA_START=481 /DNA_END=1392 /DNA_ORIENTATION=+
MVVDQQLQPNEREHAIQFDDNKQTNKQTILMAKPTRRKKIFIHRTTLFCYSSLRRHRATKGCREEDWVPEDVLLPGRRCPPWHHRHLGGAPNTHQQQRRRQQQFTHTHTQTTPTTRPLQTLISSSSNKSIKQATMEKVEEYLATVNAFIERYPTITFCEQLKDVEKKTGYPKTYFFLAAVVLLGTIVTLVGGFKLLTDLVGFLYPAYMSFKSMESAKGVPEDATQWLTYWVVFSSLSVIESVAGFIIGWIPMYYFIKLGVIIWLYHPKTKGAEVIYTQVVKTHIAPHIEKLQGSAAAASKKKE